MGGVFGGGGGGGGGQPAPKKPEPVVEKPTRSQEEDAARMRGAKRRGRQLLSDARLNAEMGMQETLGSTQKI